MSDPFSIASGTVGIISVGIQLCKQITDYAEAWRGYDEDIESIGFKAGSLKGPLKQLRDFVKDTQVTDSETANDIAEKASELERHLKRLENRLAQAKPVISDSLKEKVRNKLKKVAYPVRARDALREIKNDLDSIQTRIQFTLTIFKALQAQRTNHFEKRMSTLVEDMHRIVSTLSQTSMPAPALLKSLCDCGNEYANFADPNSQSNSITQFHPDVEACLSAITRSAKRARREDSAKTLFQYYSGWLRRQITLSFWLSNGAGAFSIAPVLEVQIYRGEGCWAAKTSVELCNNFKLVRKKGRYLEQLYEDELIRSCQEAISAGEFGPRDIDKYGRPLAMIIILIYSAVMGCSQRLGLCKFLKFIIECGFKLNNSSGRLMEILLHAQWTEADYRFALYLINHGVSSNSMPRSRCGKENLQRLLRMDSEFVDLPEIAKIILGESELDLREALKSGVANVKDHIQHLSLLELAVGWPEGVRILLEFGADASSVDLDNSSYSPHYTDDSDFPRYRDSITPLLQGGCILKSRTITSCKSDKVRSLLIDEYSKRRRTLQSLAQTCLPPRNFAGSSNPASAESILDVHAFQVFTELIKEGWPVDPSLGGGLDEDEPVYHQEILALAPWDGTYRHYIFDLTPWDDFYRAGFRDIDTPDSRGLTPLMVCCLHDEFDERAAIWLVDKGATLSRRLPLSKATIAHLLSSKITQNLEDAISHDRLYRSRRRDTLIETISTRKESIFLIPSVQDFCTCACCEGGCTTLLVALRKCNARFENPWRPSPQPGRTQYSLLLNSLIGLTETTTERDHSIIRLLTFEALGLRHTCCREISTSFVKPGYADDAMDEEEVQSIQDEDKISYQQLDDLVIKLIALFDELELPIMEFLNGSWHTHMAEILSALDSYDEEHILQTRDLGVFLKPAELYEAPAFFYLLGNQVEELEDEVTVSDDYDDDDKDNAFDDEAGDGTPKSTA